MARKLLLFIDTSANLVLMMTVRKPRERAAAVEDWA